MKNIFTPKQINDPGLGTNYNSKGGRVINKDGTLDIERRGVKFSSRNLYHYLINMSWGKFFFLVLLSYTFANSIFALLYLAGGISHIQGAVSGSLSENFLQAFFFSTQTFTTVGYGALSPNGTFTNFVAAIESLFGLMGFALITGILYGRFSKPSALILFSEKAVVAPYQGYKALMIRLVNGRSNQMVDLKAVLLLTQMETIEGHKKRTYKPLKLERSAITMFPLPWTIVHPIDEESPFYDKSIKEIRELEFEVLALIQGFDDTFSQVVHARQSYDSDEIVYNAKFATIQFPDETGKVILNVNQVVMIEMLPEIPGQADSMKEKGLLNISQV